MQSKRNWPRQQKRRPSGWLLPSPLSCVMDGYKRPLWNTSPSYSRAPPPLANSLPTSSFFSRPGATL
ncbi:hypothetical protein CPB86DRAFT_782952 [Serendipita vermifera]|nr:hypothetical protein CPB86DRAFT_782952 [Serendipita vermifera]